MPMPQAVECLDFVGEARHRLNLVGLQVADHGPAHIWQVHHGLLFMACFLDLVLGKFAAACGIGKSDSPLIYALADS